MSCKGMMVAFCAALAMAGLSGCATIVGDKTQLMPIGSTPDGASVVIRDETGADVFKGTTPTSVLLDKSDGSYWGKKSFTVTIAKPGFGPQSVAITAHANGWYIGGNIIFGGLIGWFIVDPQNGGMYTLAPKAVRATLDANGATATLPMPKDGSIMVVLLEDVPAELRPQLRRIAGT